MALASERDAYYFHIYPPLGLTDAGPAGASLIGLVLIGISSAFLEKPEPI